MLHCRERQIVYQGTTLFVLFCDPRIFQPMWYCPPNVLFEGVSRLLIECYKRVKTLHMLEQNHLPLELKDATITIVCNYYRRNETRHGFSIQPVR
mmetsp:Transcript_6235/g.7169  ORF Transcript_6235/g.7169 Transcript_6235/m.7169 type:complete len:95 (+) Transcript_6235:695-979(+)